MIRRSFSSNARIEGGGMGDYRTQGGTDTGV